MNNILDLEAFRAKRAQAEQGISILMGAEAPGWNCPHCGEQLYHAMVLPSKTEGNACRACDIWFSAC